MTLAPVGVPNATDDNHTAVLQRLIEVVNDMQGVVTANDRVIRVQDLLDAGVVSEDTAGNIVITGSSAASTGVAGDALPLVESYAYPGISSLLSRQDHVHPMTGTNVNLLYPVEKRHLVMEYAQLVNDRTGLLASAAAAGVTTEATDFDTKLTALTNYLATLVGPVLWNDKSNTTTLL